MPRYTSATCALSSAAICGYRAGSGIRRRTLTLDEARKEAKHLAVQGYDSAYCLSGSFNPGDLCIPGSMTEVNARGLQAIVEAKLFPVLESSPFSPQNFVELLTVVEGNGRFLLFQECYDRRTYAELHSGQGSKSDPEARLRQTELAREAGWPEIGIGILLGLHRDIVSELRYLVAHENYLHEAGVRKITISVPRLNPAPGMRPGAWRRSSDEDFVRAVYTLRILCPLSFLVLTGRESPEMRDMLWKVTDIWGAGGATEPGGYTVNPSHADGQFSIVDDRSLKEIREANEIDGSTISVQ